MIQHFGDVGRPVAGMPYAFGNVSVLQGNNATGNVNASGTITLSAYTDGDYTFKLDGREFTATLASESSTTTAAASILEALLEDIRFMGIYSFTQAANVITWTRTDGRDIEVSDSDSKLTIAKTVSAAKASSIPFGAPVCITGVTSTGSINVVKMSDLDVDGTYELDIMSNTEGAVDVFYIDTGLGVRTLNTIQTDALADTRTALIAALEDILEVHTVEAHGSDASMIVITPGSHIPINIGSELTSFDASGVTFVQSSFVGIAQAKSLSYNNSNGRGYAANAQVDIISKGPVWVKGDCTVGGKVYFDIDTELFTSTVTPTAVPLNATVLVGDTDGYCVIDLK